MKTQNYKELFNENYEIQHEINEWVRFMYNKLTTNVNSENFENPILKGQSASFEIYNIEKSENEIVYYIKTNKSIEKNCKADVYYTVSYDRVKQYDNFKKANFKIDETKTVVNYL